MVERRKAGKDKAPTAEGKEKPAPNQGDAPKQKQNQKEAPAPKPKVPKEAKKASLLTDIVVASFQVLVPALVVVVAAFAMWLPSLRSDFPPAPTAPWYEVKGACVCVCVCVCVCACVCVCVRVCVCVCVCGHIH
jgi:hypothetical protein